MRFLLSFLLLFGTVSCTKPPIGPCISEYEHLLRLAKRKERKSVKQRFVNACVSAYDAKRHRCVMKATTVQQAVKCQPGKVYPG